MPHFDAPKGESSPIPFIDDDSNLQCVSVDPAELATASDTPTRPNPPFLDVLNQSSAVRTASLHCFTTTQSPTHLYPAVTLTGSSYDARNAATQEANGPVATYLPAAATTVASNCTVAMQTATASPPLGKAEAIRGPHSDTQATTSGHKVPLQRQPTDDTDADVRESPVDLFRNGAATAVTPEHPRKKFLRKLSLFKMPARRMDSLTSDEEAKTPLRKASIHFTRSLLSGKSSNESNLTQQTRLPTSDSEWEDERKRSLQRNGGGGAPDSPVVVAADVSSSPMPPPLPIAQSSFQTSHKQLSRESKDQPKVNRCDSSADQQQSSSTKKGVSKKQIEEFLDELSSGSYHSGERPSQIHYNNKATGRTYRSQSVFSADPASPYYVSKGTAADNNENVRRSPSVSCVLEVLRREQREAELKGIVIPPGISLAAFDKPKVSTIRQHYYPESGWGWVICSIAVFVHFLIYGIHWCFPLLILRIRNQFKYSVDIFPAVCLGAMSMAVSLFCSPWVVGVCRRKSTRLLAVLGGLIAALAVLFTSFASQFHQLFISYGVILGCGISMTRDCSVFMVGQYFKKRRELVELILATGTGTGISVMPIFIVECIRSIGWRLGLQALTGIVFSTFILGIFYRPASLYHPQRRAILHLKSMQKRSKAKDKNPAIEKPPFFDFGVLKSRTVQILITGTAIAAVGVSSPMILFIYQAEEDGLSRSSLLYLQVFLGMSFILGSLAFGCIIVNNPDSCHIARQYLCQGACALLAVSILLCTTIHDYSGYLTFVWCYGSFYGAYLYSLKMYTLEKVRARNFAKAWGFIQCAQAIPVLIGPPVTAFLNDYYGDRRGFFVSAGCALAGSLFLFLIDVHKRTRSSSAAKTLLNSGQLNGKDCRRCSDAPNGDIANGLHSRRSSVQDSMVMFPRLLQSQRSFTFSNYADLRRQELTCISEEAIMDNLFEDLIDDCITSCNKEEKYLMLSEYENNLNKAQAQEVERRTRIAQATARRASIQNPVVPVGYDSSRGAGGNVTFSYDHCPNCMRLVPTNEDLNGSPPLPRRTSPRRSLFHRPSQAAICSVDVIEEVTSSM